MMNPRNSVMEMRCSTNVACIVAAGSIFDQIVNSNTGIPNDNVRTLECRRLNARTRLEFQTARAHNFI